jgi:3D (Asp-Asp-Asp) domain-containing protein
MNAFKKGLLTLGVTAAFTGVFAANTTVEAEAAAWEPRTVAEIEADIEKSDDESSYTIRWGDTLGTIATAFDVSLNEMVEVNEIADKNLIIAGNVLHLSADKETVSVEDPATKEVKSYDVSEKEEVKEVEEPAAQEAEEPAEEVTEEAVNEEPAAQAPVEEPQETSSTNAGEWMTFEATGYSTQQPNLSTHTATGIDLRENSRVIAVDPSVIPLGSQVEIEGLGVYTAGDTGGAINGNIIDIHYPTVGEALNWGRRNVNIRILN